MRSKLLSSLLAYGAAVVLCLLILIWVMRLWRADLTIPFQYRGDALAEETWVKGIIDNGWYLHNPYLGSPFAQDMYDFPRPMAENLHFVLLKIIALVSPNFDFAFNAYFLLAFPLITVTSLFVLRQFRFSYATALVGALLYTFLPFHFIRHESHHILAAYYMIPLSVMLAIWLCGDRPLLFQEGKRGGLPHWSGWNGVTVAALAISVLIGSENAYYAFFACFFVLVAGLASYVSRRRFYPLCNAGILNAVVILTLLVSTAPHFIYKRHQGADPDAVVRSPEHGEIYGLKIIQLLLPAEYHRVGRLRHYTDTYDRVSPLVNENVSASLGVVASVGFLFLIGRLLWLGRREGELSPLDVLCLLNIFAILLATIGGFGTVFSWGISPWIRSYNRISIYIGFFAIFMVVACLEALRRRYARSTASRVCFYAILGLLATAGILDQTPSYVSATDAFAQREYSSDAEFIGRIEAALPPDAMIYQMPHVTFPDSGHVLEYGHLRAYLHSTRLHWSHGAMKGRPEGTWQDEMASKPLQEMIPSLAHAGFGGIYVDRRGFADAGASVQAELTRIVGMPPQVSNDAKLLFFNLTAYVKNLSGRYTEKEWEAERQMTLYPQQLRYLWQNGFYFEEKDLQKRWRWCSSEGKLVIENPASRSRQVTLKMGFATAYPESTPLRIDSDLLSTPRLFKPGEDVILEKLTIMPGKHVLHFACDARRLECADARRLVFNVTNFTALGAD